MPDQPPSIHDNYLLAYTVDLEKREIHFRTKFPSDPPEFTDVVFKGVDCYSFLNDSILGTIIFDIIESPPLSVYDDNSAELIAGIRCGWPGDWAKSRETAAQFFAREGIRAYHLSASLGMTGWILARDMEKVRRKNNPE